MIAAIASQGQTYCIRLLWSGSFAIPQSPLVMSEFVIAEGVNDKMDYIG